MERRRNFRKDFPGGTKWETICLPMQEMQETGTRSLGQKDPLEEETATHPVFLSGKFRGQRSLVGFATTGLQRVGHD